MHTPPEDSHEVAQTSKLGSPVQLAPALPPEQQRLYMPQDLTLDILRDLFTRQHRIRQHYEASPLGSSEALITTLSAAEFDLVVGILADMGEWLEQMELAIFAHFTNTQQVPYGATPLPLPPAPPPYVEDAPADAAPASGPPPRYVTPAELYELQTAWTEDPRSAAWFMNGAKTEDLPEELQNIVLTKDGKAPPAGEALISVRAGQGPLHRIDLD